MKLSKNIHVLPTKKLSNLLLCIKSYVEHKDTPEENSDNKGDFRLGCGKYASKVFYKPHHMYITSDECIKEDDWLLIIDDFETYVHKHKGDNLPTTYWKIILTTDQNLIADDVQAIDDEFLEWFVNNPNCESVEIKPFCKKLTCKNKECNVCCQELNYKLLIPKEEPKQTVQEYEQQGLEKYSHELKQETLEEAAIDSKKRYINETAKIIAYREFIEGAKWQQQNSYNEEEIRNAIDYGAELGLSNNIGNSFEWTKRKNEWFEINKKK
jgi:hypothetical protein